PAILGPHRKGLSYAALHDEIVQAGATLASMGLGRGSRIGVSLSSNPEAAVTMLATMTWTTAAPLALGLGFDDYADQLARLRLDAVIVPDDEYSPLAQAAGAAHIPLVRFRPTEPAGGVTLTCAAASAVAPCAPPRGDDIAVLMQTSGTTARPKVVPLTHSQLVRSARQAPIDEHDRYLAVGPIFNSTGLMNGLLTPLAAGAATIIAGDFDGARFVDWLDTLKPTYLSSNPTMLASILDAVTKRPPAAPQSLRFVRAGSNALLAAIQRRLESVLQVPVIQGYGMTETCYIAQNPLPPGERRANSVGLAMGAELMILRDDSQSSEDGGVGEILVRGASVMRGYENDAEANRLAFHEGWFRTGDIGRIDDDGYLFITGRLTELINRGGTKVSPAAVDAVFLQHPAVREAATFAVPHPSLGQDVVTAIVLDEAESASVQALRSYALEHLLPVKVPSSVVLVDQIPKNSLGKVNRRALIDKFAARLHIDYVAPRDSDEALIAAVFAEHFELPRIGALDHFFRLGGDSLRAAQVLGSVADRSGVELALQTLFESPTVAELADRLGDARVNGGTEHPGRNPIPGRRPAADRSAADRGTDPAAAERSTTDPLPAGE
ncbi:MAG TPA: non-ribosomal peptide synthetase, partial [Casimicrobiaceae bacterium]|nr:non-ribosomal peptide synthetase [Casimicrobiaceae bacterium]